MTPVVLVLLAVALVIFLLAYGREAVADIWSVLFRWWTSILRRPAPDRYDPVYTLALEHDVGFHDLAQAEGCAACFPPPKEDLTRTPLVVTGPMNLTGPTRRQWEEMVLRHTGRAPVIVPDVKAHLDAMSSAGASMAEAVKALHRASIIDPLDPLPILLPHDPDRGALPRRLSRRERRNAVPIVMRGAVRGRGPAPKIPPPKAPRPPARGDIGRRTGVPRPDAIPAPPPPPPDRARRP